MPPHVPMSPYLPGSLWTERAKRARTKDATPRLDQNFSGT
jgi:hypothetical protein